MALLAVGGYGRRHLFPYSDIDLLLLVENSALAEGAREPISAFLQKLWDSGLRLSQSVRTPEECAEIHDQNIELNVSLLASFLQRWLLPRLPEFQQSHPDIDLRLSASNQMIDFEGSDFHLAVRTSRARRPLGARLADGRPRCAACAVRVLS